MIFSLSSFPSRHPVPSLGGASVRYKPLVPITVVGPNNQETRQVLLDTGADDVVFPSDMATRIGVNLSIAHRGTAQGVGGAKPVSILYMPVILLLSDGTDVCRWRAVVGFTQAHLRFPLFGIAGGLEHFRTTLDVGNREIEMIAKHSLPATKDAVP